MNGRAQKRAAQTPRSGRRRVAVGVTGHRPNQLPAAETPRLKRALEAVLDQVAKCAARAAPAVDMMLVSALAEGADRYAAHAALARNWVLLAPLPFEVSRYLEDFAGQESKAEFVDLFDRARPVAPEGEGGYLAVGEMILDRIDVLLALWNGTPPKGPGGTGDVAARALLRGIPVIWLPVEPRASVLVLPSRAPRAGTYPAHLRAALQAEFETIAQPDAMRLAEA